MWKGVCDKHNLLWVVVPPQFISRPLTKTQIRHCRWEKEHAGLIFHCIHLHTYNFFWKSKPPKPLRVFWLIWWSLDHLKTRFSSVYKKNGVHRLDFFFWQLSLSVLILEPVWNKNWSTCTRWSCLVISCGSRNGETLRQSLDWRLSNGRTLPNFFPLKMCFCVFYLI